MIALSHGDADPLFPALKKGRKPGKGLIETVKETVMKKLILVMDLIGFAVPSLADEPGPVVTPTTSGQSAIVATDAASDAAQTVIKPDQD